MMQIKELCQACKGKRYKRNINKQTGQTACFVCKGEGYFIREVDEDEAARLELMAMSKKELALVDCDKYKWQCRVEGCTKFTVIKDFGIAPHYYTRWGWLDLSRYYRRCFIHGKMEDSGQALPRKPGNGENHLISLTDDRV